ncbi:MAG: hypothetical protein M1826_007743 [Phylliscum demangeonii]|nr:MAG: hypothetical protein M1826_007743 [Phylliscum demangeonii]
MALSAHEIQLQTRYIRDSLSPLIASSGGAALTRPAFTSLHDFFTDLEKTELEVDVLRRTRIVRALLEIAAIGSRWPVTLVEHAEQILSRWKKDLGRLGECKAALWEPGGRMAGCLKRVVKDRDVVTSSKKSASRQAAVRRKRWIVDVVPRANAQHYGDADFEVGRWWINRACAYRDGMLDDPDADVTVASFGASAIVLARGVERENGDGTSTWTCTQADVKARAATAGLFSLMKNMRNRMSTRLLRSWKLKSDWAPPGGVRYDGLYSVVGHGLKREEETVHYTFRLRREGNQVQMEKALAHPTAEEYDDWLDYRTCQDDQRQRAAARAETERLIHLHSISEMDGVNDCRMSLDEMEDDDREWSTEEFIGGRDYRTPVELAVTGEIPAYAAGVLYRNGPGGYQVETKLGTKHSASHWFDGFAQVHRFQILPPDSAHGFTRVRYNSRTTVDGLLETIRTTGKLDQFTFGQKRDPCESYFRKVMSSFRLSGPVDTNIAVTISADLPGYPDPRPSGAGHAKGTGHGSCVRTLSAKTDLSFIKQLDPETLEPLGIAKQDVLHPALVGVLSAAHAKSDPLTGDIFNYNLDLGRRPVYRIFRVSAGTGQTDILATIDDAPGAYMHSMMLTPRYVVLCVWNAHYAWGGAKILWERNILDSLQPFDGSKPARWYVVDRHGGGGVAATYDSDPFFCFHTINAWEEEGAGSDEVDVVVDLCMYENLDVLKRFYYHHLLSSSPDAGEYAGERGDSCRPSIARWRLPAVRSSARPAKGTRTRTRTTARARARLERTEPKRSSGDLPTINPTWATRPYRYAYLVADRGQSTFFDALLKFDSLTRTRLYWSQHGHSPSEVVFIPRPADEGDGEGEHDEDDGVLLSVVLDGFQGTSYLLCLDARTMTEMGRASLPGVVAHGFHGMHVSARAGTRTHEN